MKFGVVVFPGSNCEKDMADAVRLYLKEKVEFLWHDDADLKQCDVLLLPGGFSYGDYLRSGAIARFSPIMGSIKEFAQKGGPVLGVCNGFQILTEAHLLPGALRRNESLQFQCSQVKLTVDTNRTPFSSQYQSGQVIELPIAHADGNYYVDEEALARLEDQHQVVFRYQDNVNGSVNRIAGVCNERGNVVGMMPHPERNLWPTSNPQGKNWNGDGGGVFQSILQAALQIV